MQCKQVVLVDENDAFRDAFSMVVGGRGYEVTALAGARDLSAHLAEHHDSIGLVLLELDRPGLEFLRARASVPSLARVPVVILTAMAPASVPRFPNVDVLHKPVTTDHLLGLIQRHCGNPVPGMTTGMAHTGRRRTFSGVRVVRGADFDEWQRDADTRRTAAKKP
jgi:CheY-like chemotaxis protein